MNEECLPEFGDSLILIDLFKDKFLWILSGLLAIGLGIFDVLSTWIEPIFAQYDIQCTVSGTLIALFLVAGIICLTFLPFLFLIMYYTITSFIYLYITYSN